MAEAGVISYKHFQNLQKAFPDHVQLFRVSEEIKL